MSVALACGVASVCVENLQMDTLDDRVRELVPMWLSSLPTDVLVLVRAANDETRAHGARELLGQCVVRILGLVDVLPVEVAALGCLEAAISVRWAAREVAPDRSEGNLAKLAEEAELVERLLGANYANLKRLVLEGGSALGPSEREPSEAGDTLEPTLQDSVEAWVSRYERPTLRVDDYTLIQVRRFMAKRLAMAQTRS